LSLLKPYSIRRVQHDKSQKNNEIQHNRQPPSGFCFSKTTIYIQTQINRSHYQNNRNHSVKFNRRTKLTTRVAPSKTFYQQKRNPPSHLQSFSEGCFTRRAAAAICTCRTPWPLAPGPPARHSSRLWRRTPRCSRSPRPSPWTAPGPWRTASLLPCIFPAFAATHLTKEPCTQ